jgi:hypothetical protein
MLCAATGGVVSPCRSSGTPDGGAEGLLTGFRPVRRDSQPPDLGAASGKERVAVSTAGCCCAREGDAASAARLASGPGFVIFWITNLWRGERRDDTTLNRAPLVEHLNSTSLSSIVSGWNHSAPQCGQVTVPRLPSGIRRLRLQPGQTTTVKLCSLAACGSPIRLLRSVTSFNISRCTF